jgi:hypothetical protein
MSKRSPLNKKRCSIDGCDRPHEAGGYCATHYQRFKRHGDPLMTMNPGLGLSLAERIERSSIPVPMAGCVIWTGNVSDKGYGLIGIGARDTALVHRVAWEIANGPIPEGMCVCHRCDVPLCVNPNHLFLGSQQDNMTDKMLKGRHVTQQGEEHPSAKLTEEKVRSIRGDDRSASAIAAEYGVSDSAVRHIKKGETWRHVSCV